MYHHRTEGKILSLHHVAGSGLPNLLVTLVLPTELRAIDGSSLANDSFFNLNVFCPSTKQRKAAAGEMKCCISPASGVFL